MSNELLPVLAQEGELSVVSIDGQPVVTARVLARALGYSREDAISRLYKRNETSFTDRDTFEIDLRRFNVNLTVNPQGGDPHVRVFTKRGALKVCMKSNQPKAVMVQEMLIDLYEAVESRRLVPVEALQEVQRRLDELATEVRRLAVAQETKVVYLPRSCRPWSTDNEAVGFLRTLFEAKPGLKVAEAIRVLKNEAQKNGWLVGSNATLYRIAGKLR